MVVVECRQEQEKNDSKNKRLMAMGAERSRSLHNFSLPCLKWGSQRQLRCVKDDDGAHFLRSHPSTSKNSSDFAGPSRRPFQSDRKRRSNEIADAGIEAVRKKLMLDLQTEMDRMKFAVLTDQIEPPIVAEVRPWNLRNRRAACTKDANANANGQRRIHDTDLGFSPVKVAIKSPATWNDVVGVKRPRAKFSVSLSKQEIEEDFIAIMGTRPPRKPKKRPRYVQKQLDTLFPGLWLSEVTADMYKVNENPETGKK